MINNNEMFLLKLGEVVLKGLNRRSFEDKLVNNVRRRLKSCGSFQVYIRQSTIYVEPTTCVLSRCAILRSIPSKAPPQINRIFFVFTWM